MTDSGKCPKCGRNQDKYGCRGGTDCIAHQISLHCGLNELHASRISTLSRIQTLSREMVGENIARANHAIRALGDLYEAHRTAEKSAEELIRFALEEMKEAVLLMGQRERLIDVVNEKAAVYATDIQVTSVAEGERTTY